MAVQIESDVSWAERPRMLKVKSYGSGPFFITETNPAFENGILHFIFNMLSIVTRDYPQNNTVNTVRLLANYLIFYHRNLDRDPDLDQRH